MQGAGTLRSIAALVLGAAFVVAGANHFVNPGFYVSIMPAWLPYHRELVLLSGALEILGGAAVFVPSLRQRAGWFLIALLVAVFPANVNMAMQPETFSSVSPLSLYARLPLQALLIAGTWWATRPRRPASGDGAGSAVTVTDAH